MLPAQRILHLPTIEAHLAEVKACTRCPEMIGPVITPRPVASPIYLCGQAPGPHEGKVGKPFGWTAGKQLFKWFGAIGADEERFRGGAYIAAVCRCFPGKTRLGADRVPDPDEIAACSDWMRREIAMLRPRLIIPVGKLAIEQFLPPAPLASVIGKQFRVTAFGHDVDLIPLPHPSGASTWFKVHPGRTLTGLALRRIRRHEAWRTQFSRR